ncbi:MAG: hypothetical protein DMG73_17195 [Acidobacteria bacterium]|nr:MAG: hypothetical protein DMG73_17195 [Acidobacteriota bacterium]
MDFRINRSFKIRTTIPRPERSLRSVAERVPQAEAFAAKIIVRWRPVWMTLYSARRRVATGAVVLLTVWLFLHVMFGANGMVVYRQKQAEYNALRIEIDGLQQENGRYGQQIKALQTDSRSIEKEAREQLHYARPGEVVYVTPAPMNPPIPATNEMRK